MGKGRHRMSLYAEIKAALASRHDAATARRERNLRRVREARLQRIARTMRQAH